MPNKKINIWQLLSNYPQSDINCSTHRNGSGDTVMGMEEIKEAMLDFGKQLLELAAENAKCIYVPHPHKEYDREICLGVDKQSILNTINQVE